MPAASQHPTTDPLASLPFRLEPHTASPEAIARANREQGLRHAAAYESADSAIARIRSGQRAPKARIRSWIFHPDERVPVALAGSGRNQYAAAVWTAPAPDAKTTNSVSALLYLRGRAAARDEGLHWTPVLDAVHSSWTKWGRPSLESINALVHHDDFAPYRRILESWRANVSEHDLWTDWRRERSGELPWLDTWLERERDPHRLAMALQFRHRRLAKNVAGRAGVNNDALVDAILNDHRDVVGWLIKNPQLTETQRARVLDWAVDGMAGRVDGKVADILSSAYSTLVTFIQDVHDKDGDESPKGPLSRAQVQRLVAALTDPERALRKSVGQVMYLLGLLIDDLAAEDLVRVVKACPAYMTAYSIPHMISAPHADARVWRAVLETTRVPILRLKIAKIPSARQDPDVANIMSRSDRPEIQNLLIEDVASQYFARSFRAVAARNPDHALDVLERRMEEMRGVLGPNDIAPLLSSSDQTVRLRAIGLLASLRSSRSSPRTR